MESWDSGRKGQDVALSQRDLSSSPHSWAIRVTLGMFLFFPPSLCFLRGPWRPFTVL